METINMAGYVISEASAKCNIYKIFNNFPEVCLRAAVTFINKNPVEINARVRINYGRGGALSAPLERGGLLFKIIQRVRFCSVFRFNRMIVRRGRTSELSKVFAINRGPGRCFTFIRST